MTKAHPDAQMYLNVPFIDKDMAKCRGAKWHPEMGKWYVPQNKDADNFKRWWPIMYFVRQHADEKKQKANAKAAHERAKKARAAQRKLADDARMKVQADAIRQQAVADRAAHRYQGQLPEHTQDDLPWTAN